MLDSAVISLSVLVSLFKFNENFTSKGSTLYKSLVEYECLVVASVGPASSCATLSLPIEELKTIGYYKKYVQE